MNYYYVVNDNIVSLEKWIDTNLFKLLSSKSSSLEIHSLLHSMAILWRKIINRYSQITVAYWWSLKHNSKEKYIMSSIKHLKVFKILIFNK